TGSIELPSVGQASQTPAQPIEVIVKADGKLALRDRDKGGKGGKEEMVSRDALVTRIRDLQGAKPDRAVVVAGDKAARYEEILKVMDTLQGNGITRIGLLVQTGQAAKPAR
ncbi:MAG: biopolymer transporter ExbD, partial [Methyloversatilis sp.]|nr:biopolymer transporter ExbD [Methyloversatilis sp.]